VLTVPLNQNIIVPTAGPGEQWHADKLIASLRANAWGTRTAGPEQRATACTPEHGPASTVPPLPGADSYSRSRLRFSERTPSGTCRQQCSTADLRRCRPAGCFGRVAMP
jgi:hypothetical protein